MKTQGFGGPGLPIHNALRTAGPAALGQALQATRARTLGLMQAWQSALPNLSVPPMPEINPPLWEWGHIAWFQEWWTVRNRQRHLGTQCAVSGNTFGPSLLPHADAFYNSSEVAHDSRWDLALAGFQPTQSYLAEVLQRSLDNLQNLPDTRDEALYLWRLVLLHEAMHNEASVYMAQTLGLNLPADVCQRQAKPEAGHGAVGNGRDDEVGGLLAAAPDAQISVPAQVWTQGHSGSGFAFDNELQAHPAALQAFSIDAQAVTWARYLPFLQATGHALPPHVRTVQGGWQVQRFGQWQTLNLRDAAVHLNAHDAQAWCEWADRRLPSEAEWACAAHQPGFVWGEVWEWTASDFAPYPGFVAHPYRDYSAPWWHSHRVLKGACAATSEVLADVRYRNFFLPGRRDIFSGFRSVGR